MKKKINPKSAVPKLATAAIVVPTRSGRTARLVSAFRPRVPVLAMTPRIETVRRLTALFAEARFSHHPVDDTMRAAAQRSLRSVAAALAVQPTGHARGVTEGHSGDPTRLG